MFRRAILAVGLALTLATLAHSQQPTTPPVPEDALAPRELIAWSSLQTPQPAQQQLPTSQTHPDRDSPHCLPQPTVPQQQQEPAQSQDAPPLKARDPHGRN